MIGDTDQPEPGAATDIAQPTDDLERVVARLLIGGTYVSVAVLAVGTVMMVLAGVAPLTQTAPFDPGRVADDLLHLRVEGLLWLGLIAVVATPAARVATSLVGYVRRGERLMALVSLLILGVIALSVGLARGLEG